MAGNCNSPPGGGGKKKSSSRRSPLIQPKEVLSRERRSEPRSLVSERMDIYLVAADDSTENEAAQKVSPSGTTSESTHQISGIALDFSSKGIGIIISKPAIPGTNMILKIMSKFFVHELAATVAWCSELPSTGKLIRAGSIYHSWRSGLFFTPRSEEEKEIVSLLSRTITI
jgi:hypothetical protein